MNDNGLIETKALRERFFSTDFFSHFSFLLGNFVARTIHFIFARLFSSSLKTLSPVSGCQNADILRKKHPSPSLLHSFERVHSVQVHSQITKLAWNRCNSCITVGSKEFPCNYYFITGYEHAYLRAPFLFLVAQEFASKNAFSYVHDTRDDVKRRAKVKLINKKGWAVFRWMGKKYRKASPFRRHFISLFKKPPSKNLDLKISISNKGLLVILKRCNYTTLFISSHHHLWIGDSREKTDSRSKSRNKSRIYLTACLIGRRVDS